MKVEMRAVLLLLTALALGCSKPPPPATAEIDPELLQNFQPAPDAVESDKHPITEAKIELGRRLYYEKRLSRDGKTSCNSCHPLDRYGADGTPVSTGIGGQKGGRNAPTTYHAAGQVAQFWDGRAADVEEQAKGPIMNPIEMGMANATAVESALRAAPEYGPLFAKAFPGQMQPVTLDNSAAAIGAFERKLMTPGRWDRFLKGDRQALSAEEKAGFLAFHRAGCVSCHQGADLGGKFYIKAGMAKPWPNQKDLGRFQVTGKEHHKMVFKVPTLRNVDKTAPYMHDGSVADLEAAVRMMGEHQVEKPLTDSEVRQIVAWLRALTGDLPLAYIRDRSATIDAVRP